MIDILIHIPDGYDNICDTMDTDLDYFLTDYLSGTVATCKRLSKGHGKIVDLGKIDKDRIEQDNPVIELTVNGEYIEAVSLDYLNNLPAIVEADKDDLKYKGTGRWIEMPMEFMEDFDGSGVHVLKDPLECSECGCRSSKATEYCPHCGAKMTETIWRNKE